MTPVPTDRRPRARRVLPELRREEILDAGESLLVTKGLDAVTMADVAQAAGLAKGTVYLYFTAKTELLAALRARYLDRFSARLDVTLRHTSRTKASTSIARFVDELFSFSLQHRSLHHQLFHEAGFSEDDALAALAARVHTFLGESQARGRDPEVTAAFLVAGVHGALVAAMHEDERGAQRWRDGARLLAQRVVGG